MWQMNLKCSYGGMSSNQKKVVDSLLKQEQDVCAMTLSQCAVLSGVGEPTVLRMLKQAGYKSWKAFKEAVLRQQGDMDIQQDLSKRIYFQVIQDDLKMISDLLYKMDFRQLEEVRRRLCRAKMIDIYGTDNSQNAAAELSGRLLHLGLPSRNYPDLFYQKISAGHLGKKDMVIGFSISGETKAVIEAFMAAKKQGASTVAITSDPKSVLAKISDFVFVTPTISYREESQWITSRISQMAFVDVLCASILESDPDFFSNQLRQSTQQFDQDILHPKKV